MKNKHLRTNHHPLKKRHGHSAKAFTSARQNDTQIRQALQQLYARIYPPDEAKAQLLKLADQFFAIE